MLELEDLQFLAQIIDSSEPAIEKLEKAYNDKDEAAFQNSKKTILEFWKITSKILKNEKKK